MFFKFLIFLSEGRCDKDTDNTERLRKKEIESESDKAETRREIA